MWFIFNIFSVFLKEFKTQNFVSNMFSYKQAHFKIID